MIKHILPVCIYSTTTLI